MTSIIRFFLESIICLTLRHLYDSRLITQTSLGKSDGKFSQNEVQNLVAFASRVELKPQGIGRASNAQEYGAFHASSMEILTFNIAIRSGN